MHRNHHELKFSTEQGYFDQSIGVRFFIAFLFAACLFFVLHFREVRVEVFELNSTASRYVVSQTDFQFFDEEATIILKQEAVRDIGNIYRISDKQIKTFRLDFEKSLVNSKEWRDLAEESTFNEMYQALDALEKTLYSVRFTTPRTIQKMRELGLSTSFYFSYTPMDINEPVLFPQKLWESIQQLAFHSEQFQQETMEYLLKEFEVKSWELDEDLSAQRILRKKIQALVPEKYTEVSAGSRIIDQGERVTSRHIAILIAMKNALNEQRRLFHLKTLLGSALLSLILTALCSIFIRVHYPQILDSNRKLFLIVTVMILTCLTAKATEFFLLSSKGNLMETIRYPLFVPFAAILLCSLLNPTLATFASVFLTIILATTLSFEVQGFMILNLIAALVTILSSHTLRQRKEIFFVCGKAWLCCIGVIVSLHLYQEIQWNSVAVDIACAGGFMLMTAVFVIGMLPLLETCFRIMTDVTLMEYMDPNHELLRRLSIEAPGTYQHSVIVGNLAETAALSIGANGLFCRVATLYHDIGKMATPQYFTENQHGGMNIHQLLTPEESAQVIIAHVAEGVALARKAGLPEQFIDVIKEHHGTTLVYYFYRKAIEKAGGERSEVDEKAFRYSGPKPHTKESAIIMIADSLEAASRSLDKMTENSVMDLINRIVKDKMEDGQFDHTLLSLHELATVKETLVKTLVAYGHSRVKYPSKEDLGEETLREDL